MVVVNNGPIFLPMILSTIKTYNAKPFQIHRLMLSHNNQSFHTKQSQNQVFFIFSNTLFWIDPHIFTYLNYLIFKYILDICLFSHFEFIFYSINSNNNVVDIVSRIHCYDAFIDLWQQWYFQQYDYHSEFILPFLR